MNEIKHATCFICFRNYSDREDGEDAWSIDYVCGDPEKEGHFVYTCGKCVPDESDHRARALGVRLTVLCAKCKKNLSVEIPAMRYGDFVSIEAIDALHAFASIDGVIGGQSDRSIVAMCPSCITADDARQMARASVEAGNKIVEHVKNKKERN